MPEIKMTKFALAISNVTKKHAGIYACKGTNEDDSLWMNFTLVVTGELDLFIT